jgi:hypothetical protein
MKVCFGSQVINSSLSMAKMRIRFEYLETRCYHLKQKVYEPHMKLSSSMCSLNNKKRVNSGTRVLSVEMLWFIPRSINKVLCAFHK